MDGFALCGPLSVNLSDIYMAEMDNDAAITSKPMEEL